MDRIILENITKGYNIAGRKKHKFLANILDIFSIFGNKKNLEVLKNINLQVKAGEILGIVGGNGSGKSTLLRIMAGIYRQDKGKVIINGKIISLINLYVGLKEQLAMRDNIFLLGSLFGLSHKETSSKFNLILEFSGLRDFLDAKIHQLSLGMAQRIVFSVAIHSNPDILLLDEVFEIGDEDFREKSVQKIKEIVKNGTSVVLVSHDIPLIEKHCNRIIHLASGMVINNK